MNFSKKARLVYLAVVFAVLGGIYWGFGATALTMPITIAYYGVCLVLSIVYVLINGGITPIESEQEGKKAEKKETRETREERAHPLKRKDRYRRFRSAEEEEKEDVPDLRPNPLKLEKEKRLFLSQSILIFLIPLYAIFLLDWILLKFLV